VERIKGHLLGGTALASDETGVRIGWIWVVHHSDSAAFMADFSRSYGRKWVTA
jgi:transposase